MSNDSSGSRGPVSKRDRFFKLAGMTASVAGEYAKSQMKSAFQNAEEMAKDRAISHGKTGERIAATLGELKGAAMKVGQMASIGSDLLLERVGHDRTVIGFSGGQLALIAAVAGGFGGDVPSS